MRARALSLVLLALPLVAGCGGHSSRKATGSTGGGATTAQVVTVTPATGPAAGGNQVTVTVAGFAGSFQPGVDRVLFGTAPLTSITVLAADRLSGVAPAGSGSVDVVVEQGTQQATLAGGYTYLPAPPPPPPTPPALVGLDSHVTIAEGLGNPGLSAARAPAAGLVLAQVRLTTVVDATLTALRVSGEGSIDEATGAGEFALYQDLDHDGALDANEPRLGTTQVFARNGGSLDFPLQLDLAPGAPADLLVVGELRAAALVGDVLAVRVVAQGSSALLRGTTTPLVVGGGAEGGTLQVAGAGAPATLTVALAPQSPSAPSAAADALDAPLLALRLSAGAGTLDVHGLRFQCSGTGDDARDLLELKLARDLNGNGQLDPTDTLLAVDRPTGDDGELRFSLGGLRLSAGQSADLLVAASLAGTAPAGATFRVALAGARGVIAHGSGDGGSQVTLAATPLAGAPLTVSAAAGGLLLRAIGRTPARVAAAGGEVEALALELRAGGQAASVSQLELQARGTADDTSHLTGISVWQDSDGSGGWSPLDQRLVGPLAFPSDDGAVTAPFAAVQVPAGGARTLIVTARFAAGAPAGRSFHLRCDPARAGARGPLAIGTLLVVGSGASAVTQPGPGAGKDAHLRGEGLYLNDNFGHAQTLSVGDRPSGQLGGRVSFLQLPRPQLPAGSAPRRAWLALFVASTGALVAPSLEVQAYRVIDSSGGRTPWIEGQGGFDAALDGICWDGTIQSRNRPDLTQPDTDPTLLDRVSVTQASLGEWVLLEVTPAAQAWYAGTAADHGLYLREANFAAHVDGEVYFWASEGRFAGLRPLLLVEY